MIWLLVLLHGYRTFALELTEDQWTRTRFAGTLLYRVSKDEVSDYSTYMFGDMKATLAQRDNRCFVAFSGSVETSFWEYLFGFSRSVCNDNSCCSIRTSYAKAAEEAATIDGLQTEIEDCLEAIACTDPHCLIVTGYDRGAGVAAAASILWRDLYNPWYIGLRQPMLIRGSSCEDAQYWHRYVNARVDYRAHIFTLVYDFESHELFPLQWFKRGGHMMVLADDRDFDAHDDEPSVAYHGLNANPILKPIDFTGISRSLLFNETDITSTPGFDPEPETYGGYLDRILDITAAPVFGFPEEHLCTTDEQCFDGTDCQRLFVCPLPPHFLSPSRCWSPGSVSDAIIRC